MLKNLLKRFLFWKTERIDYRNRNYQENFNFSNPIDYEKHPLVQGFLGNAKTQVFSKNLKIELGDSFLEKEFKNFPFGKCFDEKIQKILEQALEDYILCGEVLLIKFPFGKLLRVNPKDIIEIKKEDLEFKSIECRIGNEEVSLRKEQCIFLKRGFEDRGVSYIEPIKKYLDISEKYRAAVLKNAEINAKNMGVFSMSSMIGDSIGGKEREEEDLEKTKNILSKSFLNLKDHSFLLLPAGSQALNTFSRDGLRDHQSFLREQDQLLAAALNISYTALKKDYSKSSFSTSIFSSEKDNDMYRTLEQEIHNEILFPIIEFFLFYKGKIELSKHIVIFPKNHEAVDKRKAALTDQINLKIGKLTLKDIASERGLALEEYIEELKNQKELMIKNNLKEEYESIFNLKIIQKEREKMNKNNFKIKKENEIDMEDIDKLYQLKLTDEQIKKHEKNRKENGVFDYRSTPDCDSCGA